MNVLILSCNTGGGHNAAGKAMLERIIHEGHSATMLDMMLLSGEKTSKIVGGSYVGIVTHTPRLFKLIYKAGIAVSSNRHKSPVYYANALLANNLKNYLDENNFDVILSPHLYPAETLTYMKSKDMLNEKVVAISTDYTCIPFWEETNCDYYIIPHRDLIDEYVKRGVPKDKLVPLGIPVGMAFSEHNEKVEMRTKLKLPALGKGYLVIGGSMGFGKLHQFVKELVKIKGKEDFVVVVCGGNSKMFDTLNADFDNDNSVFILGYTKRIAEYMDACDVVFTKPGGLTSTEAAVKNIPIVHTAPIPGCETINRQFFMERGLSLSSNTEIEQIAQGKMLAESEEKKAKMIKSQKEQINRNASLDIFNFIQSL